MKSTILLTLLSFTGLAVAQPAEPKFEAQTIDDIQIGYGVEFGDVDGDGEIDILLADKEQFVWYRNPGSEDGEWERFVMVENLTERDNVAIAARDINGDGQVEVAVGARWNPGEVNDPEQSGSVHYLIRPDDPTQKWEPVELHHEPTVHRMRWVRVGENEYNLVVLPLRARDDQPGVRALAYEMPDDPSDGDAWETTLINDTMHATHNLDVTPGPQGPTEWLLIAGEEGVLTAWLDQEGQWNTDLRGVDGEHYAAGEVRAGVGENKGPYEGIYATIEPMHGNSVVVYTARYDREQEDWQVERQVLDQSFSAGHALGTGDFLGMGRDQIVAGWRQPNDEEKVGVKMYVPTDDNQWTAYWIDNNEMAAEDMKVADLNGDDRPDIIVSGRATNNLKVYWNRAGDEAVEPAEKVSATKALKLNRLASNPASDSSHSDSGAVCVFCEALTAE